MCVFCFIAMLALRGLCFMAGCFLIGYLDVFRKLMNEIEEQADRDEQK